MTYNSKKSLTSIIVGVLLLVIYIMFATSSYAPQEARIDEWSKLMLIFIGIGILALIVIQIVFNVVHSIYISIKDRDLSCKEIERIVSSSYIEDERDRQINAKTSLIGYFFVGIGFVLTLILVSIGSTFIVALHVMFASFWVSSVVEGCVSIYYNERGITCG